VPTVEFMTDRTVYVLHFDRPVMGNAQHYTGITQNLRWRLISHTFGDGAAFTRAAQAKGIPFTLAYTIAPAPGLDELAVKHVAAWRHCPLCGGDPERAVGNKVGGKVIRTPEEWELEQMEASAARELRRVRSTELTDDPNQAAARRKASLKPPHGVQLVGPHQPRPLVGANHRSEWSGSRLSGANPKVALTRGVEAGDWSEEGTRRRNFSRGLGRHLAEGQLSVPCGRILP
jgi:predicted GIY-YIG superfamily endonuclease